MADSKISALTELATLGTSDALPVVDNSGAPVTKKVLVSTLDARYLNTAGDTTTGNITFGGRMIVPMGELSYFNLTGTTITITGQSDGSTNMVKMAPTTTLAADHEFDNGGGNNGTLRYTGATTKMFHVACSVSIGGGNGDTFVMGIAKNGTVIDASKVLRKMGAGGDIGSTAMHVMVEMATNEYLEIFVGNTTDTDDPTVYTLNLFAFGA